MRRKKHKAEALAADAADAEMAAAREAPAAAEERETPVSPAPSTAAGGTVELDVSPAAVRADTKEHGRSSAAARGNAVTSAEKHGNSAAAALDNPTAVAEEHEVSPDAARDKKIDLVVFQAGAETFAFRLTNVREIVRIDGLRAVPHASEHASAHVVGLCSWRGRLLPAVDVRQCLRMPVKAYDENSRMIVIEIDGQPVGMIADRILGVTGVEGADVMTPPPAIRNYADNCVDGIVVKDRRIMMLLDEKKMIHVEPPNSAFAEKSS